MTLTKENEIRRAELEATIKRLEEKRDEYEERLNIGGAKIEEARNQGKDVTAWEDYFIKLLREYEAVIDKIRDLESGGVDKC